MSEIPKPPFFQIEIPNWEKISKIQKIKVINTMYIWLFIVPVAAKMLNGVQGLADLLIFGHHFNVELGLPFSWKIFYFSALCFALSNFIYILFCPTLLKDYMNYQEFKNHRKSMLHLYGYANDAKTSLEGWRAFGKGANSPDHEGVETEKIFWELFDVLSEYKIFWRTLSSLLYIVGFAMIFIIVMQNLETVVRLSFNL